MKVETKDLLTVKNFSSLVKRNRSRIYQLIESGKIVPVEIDGITFVNKNEASKITPDK